MRSRRFDWQPVKKLVEDYLWVYGQCRQVPLCRPVFRLKGYVWSSQKGWRLVCQVQKQVDVVKGRLAEPVEKICRELQAQADKYLDKEVHTAYEFSLFGEEGVMHVRLEADA